MTTENTTLIEKLSWRYAVKKFDAAKKIPASKWEQLEKALLLSPSSYGLQPWKFYVVSDPAIRKELRAVAWDQSQITDASHLVVICRRDSVDEAYIDRFIATIAAEREISAESLDGYRNMMAGTAKAKGSDIGNWTGHQAYIALGVLLTSAALLDVDACPMEGFVPAKFDEILGLSGTGYKSTVVCALGYRAADDPYQHAKKVRFPANELIVRR